MIFVILGTQKIPFTRLLKAVDQLIEREGITEEVVAQSGHTAYSPRNFRCVPFLSESEFQDYIARSSVVITHSGSGSIFSAMAQKKKIIAVARLHKYGEMVDDHQGELVRKLSQEGCIIDGTVSLEEAWAKARSFVPRFSSLECSLEKDISSLIKPSSRILFVCNKGGHYSEMMCLSSLRSSFDVWMLSDNKAADQDFGSRSIYIEAFNYSNHKKLHFIANFLKSLRICASLKPDCIISTGAGIAVPVFLAARLFSIKLIFIESRARVYTKSKAGRIICRIADRMFVQWSEMVGVYGPNTRYSGTLI